MNEYGLGATYTLCIYCNIMKKINLKLSSLLSEWLKLGISANRISCQGALKFHKNTPFFFISIGFKPQLIPLDLGLEI